ncbi:MAG: hypothetical protein II882_03580 [Lachnospiraceae bacterium]|nr:hypothetical protein [Lachnospiraceae bacterium]
MHIRHIKIIAFLSALVLVCRAAAGCGRVDATTEGFAEASAAESTAQPADTAEETAESTEEEPAILPQEAIAALPLEEGAPRVVEAFLSLYRSCDPQASQYLHQAATLDYPALQAEIAKNIRFTVGETSLVQKDGETAYAAVKVDIDSAGFQAAYEAVEKELTEKTDSAEALKMLTEKLGSADAEQMHFEIEVMVLDYVTSQEIVMTPELTDALTGGLRSYLQQLEEGESSEETVG